MQTPSVWVVNNSELHDYRPAESHGTLKELTRGRVNVFAVERHKRALAEALREATKEDKVLISGYSVLNGIVMHYFLKRFGFVRLLMWEANRQTYKVVTMKDFDGEVPAQ